MPRRSRAGEGGERPDGLPLPFQGSGGSDLDATLADVRASTLEKAGEITALRSVIDTGAVARTAYKLRERLDAGGRLLAFGNGGSATDAQDLAADALARCFPAVALNNDAATVTAVANDVGTEQIFARQLIALGARRRRHRDLHQRRLAQRRRGRSTEATSAAALRPPWPATRAGAWRRSTRSTTSSSSPLTTSRASRRPRRRSTTCCSTRSMRFVDEYRDPALAKRLAAEIAELADPGRTYKLMEVCGGTPTPSTSTASRTCCPTTSSWSTAPAARSA